MKILPLMGAIGHFTNLIVQGIWRERDVERSQRSIIEGSVSPVAREQGWQRRILVRQRRRSANQLRINSAWRRTVAFATEYNDATKLREYFDGLLSDWAMNHYTINEFVAQGDAVVARGSCAWTNKRTGKVAETPKLDFWRFKDGKAIEFYEYFDTACVMSAAT
jgi:predicted SnoaL-like aldol condensation-catalyzing enzyme